MILKMFVILAKVDMKVQMLANIIPVINYANALLIIIIILALV